MIAQLSSRKNLMTGQYVKEKIVASGTRLSDVARSLGITPQSLDERLSAKDMKVGVLTEIASAVNKPLAYFFEGYGKTLTGYSLNEPQSPYGKTNQVDPDLEEKIKLQQEIIAAQKKTIEAYERMLNQQEKK
ncbi:hypothetical protein ACAW74_25965 [Fibrella sp. WM1]|uniref:hypothetical protein n=1 Tax=Fibrella musci TaxID=3242485 RepID=UPI0035226C29